MSRRRRSALEQAARDAGKHALRGLVRAWPPQRADLPFPLWHLSRGSSGALTRSDVNLLALLGRRGSPLQVVFADRLASNAARFSARPPSAHRACEVYYSYKTNPVPGVLQFLHARGVGAEVVSAYELWLALRLGVDPSRIVYNGPAKSADSLRTAFERGVGLVNMNDRSEIARAAAIARRMGARPRVGIRVVAPGTLGGQFGERIDTGAALAAFREALAAPNLRVVALHAHYNGEIASTAALDAFLTPLLAFTDRLHDELGVDLEVLDLGGNLACPTTSHLSARAQRLAVTFGREALPRDPRSVLSIEDYTARVMDRVERHFAERGRPAPRVFVEPGRAITGDAQMLLCRVVAVRDPDEAGVTWSVLDAGINVAESLRSEIHQIFPLDAPRGHSRLYRLTGPSCTLGDQLFPAVRLPELALGDALGIMDSGAYFVPFSTCFSFPRPAIVMISDGRDELLRDAETFEDLVALDEEPQPADISPSRRVGVGAA